MLSSASTCSRRSCCSSVRSAASTTSATRERGHRAELAPLLDQLAHLVERGDRDLGAHRSPRRAARTRRARSRASSQPALVARVAQLARRGARASAAPSAVGGLAQLAPRRRSVPPARAAASAASPRSSSGQSSGRPCAGRAISSKRAAGAPSTSKASGDRAPDTARRVRGQREGHGEEAALAHLLRPAPRAGAARRRRARRWRDDVPEPLLEHPGTAGAGQRPSEPLRPSPPNVREPTEQLRDRLQCLPPIPGRPRPPVRRANG